MDNDFISQLHQLLGQSCWGYVGGIPTGSIISLDFGQKVKRNQKINNKHLTTDQQHYVGQFSLMIWCAWRLDEGDTVICGWNDSNEINGPMLNGLDKLVNRLVKAVKVEKPAYDLMLQFEDELYLKIFCDQTDTKESFGNYTYFVEGYNYRVEAKGQITKAESKNRL